jgi:hypothetical protein
MRPIEYLGRNILEVLSEVRRAGGVIEYSLIEGDEYIKFPEEGFFLHSMNGTGEISDCRIYFEGAQSYFPAKTAARGKFAALSNLEGFETVFGPAVRDIRAIKITGAEPTLPGKVYEVDGQKVTVYSADGHKVSYIHVKYL